MTWVVIIPPILGAALLLYIVMEMRCTESESCSWKGVGTPEIKPSSIADTTLTSSPQSSRGYRHCGKCGWWTPETTALPTP